MRTPRLAAAALAAAALAAALGVAAAAQPGRGGRGRHRGNGALRSSFDVPLTELGGDDAYVGNVSIGSPPQALSIQVDLMSSDLWVPANLSLPAPHRVFDRAASSTYRYDGANVTLPFLPRLNASVLVEVSDDALALGGGAVSVNVTFGLAVRCDEYFVGARYDGILGLGLDDLTRVSRATVMDRLVAQHRMEPLFSLFLARSATPPAATPTAASSPGGGGGGRGAGAPSPRPQPSHESVLTLGDYDMRYAVDPKAQPLWLPLVPSCALATPRRRQQQQQQQRRRRRAVGATGYDLWRLALPHVTLDCSASGSSASDVCGGATSSSARSSPLIEEWAAAAAAAAWRAPLLHHRPPPPPSSAAGAWTAAPPPPRARRLGFASPGGSVDVCGSGGDDTGGQRRRPAAPSSGGGDAGPTAAAAAAVGDGDGCSAVLTPSSRGIGVPIATLPLLLAAINASCGGGCMLVPVRGLGFMCPVGQCGEQAAAAGGGRGPAAGSAGGDVPWGMPNLTFTFDASPAPDGGGCVSDDARPVAGDGRAAAEGPSRRRRGLLASLPLHRPLGGSDGDGDAGDGDAGDGSSDSMWDVTLTPADFTLQLSAPRVRALLQAEAARLGLGSGAAAPHPPSTAAAAVMAALLARMPPADDGGAPRSGAGGYYRVLLSPFAPLPGASGSAWVLGVPFLQALYTVYDGAGMQVGLAAAIEGHAPQPSRYNAPPDAGWNGFFGSRAMWVTVGSVLATALAGVFLASRYRRRRRHARAAAFERDFREHLLLGLPVSEQPGGGGGGGGGGGDDGEASSAALGAEWGGHGDYLLDGGHRDHDGAEFDGGGGGGYHHHHAAQAGGGGGLAGGGSSSSSSNFQRLVPHDASEVVMMAFPGGVSGAGSSGSAHPHPHHYLADGWGVPPPHRAPLQTEGSFYRGGGGGGGGGEQGGGALRPTATPLAVAVSLTRPVFGGLLPHQQQQQQQQQPQHLVAPSVPRARPAPPVGAGGPAPGYLHHHHHHPQQHPHPAAAPRGGAGAARSGGGSGGALAALSVSDERGALLSGGAASPGDGAAGGATHPGAVGGAPLASPSAALLDADVLEGGAGGAGGGGDDDDAQRASGGGRRLDF